MTLDEQLLRELQEHVEDLEDERDHVDREKEKAE